MSDVLHAPVAGKRFLRAIGCAILGAVSVGTVAYLALRVISLPEATSLQLVVLLVYAALFTGLCSQFRPILTPPIALKPSGVGGALLAILVLIATFAVALLAYVCLRPLLGSLHQIAFEVTAKATDATRLHGAPVFAWVIAGVRGCLLVPLFEETLFRGLLLAWLKRHMRFVWAVLVMAVSFAVEHGSLTVAPFVFIFAISAAWLREETGSLFNSVLMHSLTNVITLIAGLKLHGG